MLPNRSKRYAIDERQIKRQQLVSPLELSVFTVTLLVFMAFIFPRDALITRLSQQEDFDWVAVSYLENLIREDDSNLDLRLQLVKIKFNDISHSELEELLETVNVTGSEAQRVSALLLHFRAAMKQAQEMDQPEQHREATTLLQMLQQYALPPSELITLADGAVILAMDAAALELYYQAEALESGRYVGWLERSAEYSLGKHRYQAAANFYFHARRQTNNENETRRLFIEGINALMASSLYKEVLAAADLYLGDLESDPPTLRFLVKVTRAAGAPEVSAAYARKLLRAKGATLVVAP